MPAVLSNSLPYYSLNGKTRPFLEQRNLAVGATAISNSSFQNKQAGAVPNHED